MRTNPTNYYELLAYGLGNSSFQQFVDRFKEKYNVPNTEGYAWDPEIQLGYTYEQMISALQINTLPVYMDADAEALDKSLGEFKIGSNKIPTQKHRFAIDTRILREKMMMVQQFGKAALNGEMQNALMDLMFDSTDKLIAGNHNALTHQRMRINSTGKFTIGVDNNPRGITGLTFDFGVTDKTSLTSTSRWWTNASHTTANEGSASDPLMDLKNKIKELKKKGFPKMHIEMSETLFDDLLLHSKVLSRIGLALYPNSDNSNVGSIASNLTDEAKKAAIRSIIGAEIKTYDSVAAVESFNSTTKKLGVSTIESFDPLNIAFIPDGNIGTIKAVKPLFFAEDPTQQNALFDGGRTLLSTRFEAKTRSMYVESEMATLLVPSMPQYMAIMTVTV